MARETTQLAVLGAGPGGYAAAFYAADKGRKVVLVESDARLGEEPESVDVHGRSGAGSGAARSGAA